MSYALKTLDYLISPCKKVMLIDCQEQNGDRLSFGIGIFTNYTSQSVRLLSEDRSSYNLVLPQSYLGKKKFCIFNKTLKITSNS